MNSLKFYILCTRNINALKRHFSYIPKEDVHVVINTQDTEFEQEARQYCELENITFSVTTSDGTASTGKNAFLDIFESSDNDLAVLVDGDDFLTRHGVWTYKQIASMESPPDVLSLEYQYGMVAETGYNRVNMSIDPSIVYNPFVGCKDRNNPTDILAAGFRCFLKPFQWWERGMAGKLIKEREDDGFSAELNADHTSWVNHCYKYINKWETHCRIVMFSKKAVEGFRFDPALVVGEDTVLYFLYKHEHMEGRLEMKYLFDRYPTYVYDMRIDGVVEKSKDVGGRDRGWKEWLSTLVNSYDELESQGKLHTERLPELTVCSDSEAPDAITNADITWPENYVPDIDYLVNYPGPRKVKF